MLGYGLRFAAGVFIAVCGIFSMFSNKRDAQTGYITLAVGLIVMESATYAMDNAETQGKLNKILRELQDLRNK